MIFNNLWDLKDEKERSKTNKLGSWGKPECEHQKKRTNYKIEKKTKR